MKTMKIKFAELKAESGLEQLEKVREEFLEFSTATGYQNRLEEAFDLMQATATFIVHATGNKKTLKAFNKRHLNKMKTYLQMNRVRGK
jgi:RAB protein geranylgeranyltransferase component A